MSGGVTDLEGPAAAVALRRWAAAILGKHDVAWEPEVTWDAQRREGTIRFRSGDRVGPAEPCALPQEWLRDPERRLLCERDLVRAANRFAAELQGSPGTP